MDLEFDQEKLREICEKYDVAELRVFGSFARGQATEQSDVDVLYQFKDPFSIGLRIITFAEELEELFGRDVDIVEADSVPEWLTETIVTNSVALYDAA